MLGTAFSALSLVGLAPETDQPFVMDTMLAGLAEGCEMSPDLAVFREQLVADGSYILPPGAAEHFVEAQIAVHDDYREIVVPVDGVWQGHRVDGLLILAGIDNGISAFSVVFDAEDIGVADTFAPLAVSSNQRMADDPENIVGASAAFGTFQGRTQYICDFSN
ncbi:hypothetical protein SAMN04487974_10364 [Pelagibacterium luteolum]|uniref:Uncharacterized protein n=2 Tax=Pelagibacterium luteolum TaxID=440168 RepID=A0A1G7UID9_9HYPH|nr:hypothetical protein SAMN04487974_10364 [Pelagibacterium luteolum]